MRKSLAVLSVTSLGLFLTTTALAQETVPAADGSAAYRPAPLGVGLGFGYVFERDDIATPARESAIDIWKPTDVSARIILTPQLMLEPRVRMEFAKTTNEAAGVSVDSSVNTFAVGGRARYALASRGNLDLSALAGLELAYQSRDPGGPMPATSTTTVFDLEWGFGIDWYFTSNWSLSLDAVNPFFTYAGTSTDNPGMAPDTSSSTTLFGIIFDPRLFVMTHLYF